MAFRNPLTGRYIKANEARLRSRADESPDPRSQFYVAILSTEHFGEYYRKVGSLIVQPATTSYSVTADMEVKYAVRRGWLIPIPSEDEDASAFENVPTVEKQDLEAEVAKSMRLSSEERRKRLKSASKKPRKVQLTTSGYVRNPDVIAEVLLAANGICQECDRPAPFKKATNGEPYLEVHHRVRLADGGEDTVQNAVAVCPNCHRKAHYGSPTWRST